MRRDFLLMSSVNYELILSIELFAVYWRNIKKVNVSLNHLKFSYPYICKTGWCKPYIFSLNLDYLIKD